MQNLDASITFPVRLLLGGKLLLSLLWGFSEKMDSNSGKTTDLRFLWSCPEWSLLVVVFVSLPMPSFFSKDSNFTRDIFPLEPYSLKRDSMNSFAEGRLLALCWCSAMQWPSSKLSNKYELSLSRSWLSLTAPDKPDPLRASSTSKHWKKIARIHEAIHVTNWASVFVKRMHCFHIVVFLVLFWLWKKQND